MPDASSPTALHYKHTGYLVFDYFITDENGNATLDFEADNSYHVLWTTPDSDGYDSTGDRSRTADDGPLKTSTFDADLSEAYPDTGGDDYTPKTVSIFGEWEHLPVGGIHWHTGDFTQMKLTEESFHGSGGTYAGSWATAMIADIPFTITQKWYLSNETDSTVRLMYKIDATRTAGLVNLSAGMALIWKADEASQGIRFPPGNWTVLLMLDATFAEGETMSISIGAWNGDGFTPAHNDSYHFVGDGTKIPVLATFPVGSFSIPSGDYLAVNITNEGSGSLDLRTGKDYVSCSSPESDPGYPVSELQSVILFGTGMLFLVFFWRLRKPKET